MKAKKSPDTRINVPPDANNGDHDASSKNGKSARKVQGTYPRGDVRHWERRVKKDASKHFFVQIAHQGQRHRFTWKESNAEAVAPLALALYRKIVVSGWPAALAEHKPETMKAKAPAVTVGKFIEVATRLSSARPESLDAYAKALRRITAGVMGLENGRKYDFKRGSAEWRAKVDATPLDKLTPAAVLEWKNSFLKANGKGEERGHAAVTLNSLIRNSKALLSKKIAPFLKQEITLPAQLWFDGITSEAEPSLRYRSKIDAGKIIAAARSDLADKEPEAFKLLLLTLVCGLRRSEADSLLWEQVDLERSLISLHDTEIKRLKSKDSGGDIGLDAELVALLRGYRARDSGKFVLKTPKKARLEITEHKSRGYRCDATHRVLLDWLRKQKVPGKRPIHTLRKEIGSIIASRDGIFKASRYLRHSDIRITSRLYADTKIPVCAGLGAMLAVAADEGGIIKPDFKKEPQPAAAGKPRKVRA